MIHAQKAKNVVAPLFATSIGTRFGVNIFANSTKSAFTFVTALLLARGLGPEQYGRYAFLLAAFVSFHSLTEMGSARAFFTFASKSIRSRSFFIYYVAWLALQFSVPLLIIALFFPADWTLALWKEESIVLLSLAYSAAYMQQSLWTFIGQMAESQRKTAQFQILNVAVACTHLILIGIALYLGTSNIQYIYALIVGEILLAVAIAYFVWLPKFEFCETEVVHPTGLLKEFAQYCWPLIPHAWLGFLYSFVDVWLLRSFGGTKEMAYYSVAAQISLVALLATSSILRIFWKEISEANHEGNSERVQELYHVVIRGMFFLCASLAGLLLPWSQDIIVLSLGEDYRAGALAFSIMLLYPLTQTLGQITTSMFLATEKTRAYSILGALTMITSIILSYFLLASPENNIPGLGLGAIGLALKMVGLHFITVNIGVWILCRMNNWRFDFLYQLLSMAFTITAGFLAHYLTIYLLPEGTGELIKFPVASIFYGLVILSGVYLYCRTTSGQSFLKVIRNLRYGSNDSR